WNPATGELVRSLGRPTTLTLVGARYSADGRRVVTADRNGFRVCEAATGQSLLAQQGHTASVYALAVAGAGGRVATGDGAGTVKVWDLNDGRLLHTMPPLSRPVVALAFSPEGKTLAAAEMAIGQTVRLWEVETGKVLWTSGDPTGAFVDLAFSPDGKRLALADTGLATAGTLAVETGATRVACRAPPTGRAVAFSPDGRQLATAGGDGVLRVWDAATGREQRAFRTAHVLSTVGPKWVAAVT